VKFGISFTTTHLNQAGALLHVYADGSIQINHGGTEMGQGLYTKVAQVVAQAFGVGLDQVRITATRTDKVPNTSATAASSGADLNGMAALDAAETIRARLADFCARTFGCEIDAVVFAGGEVQAGGERMPWATLCRRAHMARISLSATGFYATPDLHYDRAAHQGQPFYYFAYGAALAEVVIDTLTGEHRVLAADILHDCGRSLNPAIDKGQIEGGFLQGQGWLTSEELVGRGGPPAHPCAVHLQDPHRQRPPRSLARHPVGRRQPPAHDPSLESRGGAAVHAGQCGVFGAGRGDCRHLSRGRLAHARCAGHARAHPGRLSAAT
jgi:xanthine dehydrogenase large subunit